MPCKIHAYRGITLRRLSNYLLYLEENKYVQILKNVLNNFQNWNQTRMKILENKIL